MPTIAELLDSQAVDGLAARRMELGQHGGQAAARAAARIAQAPPAAPPVIFRGAS